MCLSCFLACPSARGSRSRSTILPSTWSRFFSGRANTSLRKPGLYVRVHSFAIASGRPWNVGPQATEQGERSDLGESLVPVRSAAEHDAARAASRTGTGHDDFL